MYKGYTLDTNQDSKTKNTYNKFFKQAIPLKLL